MNAKYDGEDRREDHGCVHEQDWGKMMEWKDNTQKIIDRVSGMIIGSVIQLILLVVIAGGIIYEVLKTK